MNTFFAAVAGWFEDLKNVFYICFIKDDRWKYLTDGLANTIVISLGALLMGVVLGVIIAVIRSAHEHTGKLKLLDSIAKLYVTIIRGTPMVLQLMIMYYVIFATVNINKTVVAIAAFGINSGAYVSEIVRSGIMSIDIGQMEAGRSLGLNYSKTMVSIILPQAIKNILPALANEFITLLKETSVAGYIGLDDLTRGGDIIRSLTYQPFMPLIAVALVYLVMVICLTKIFGILERRLRASDKR